MRLLLGLVTLVAFASAVASEDCLPSGNNPEVQSGSYFFENDLCQPICVVSSWLYEEENGVAGLQRFDPAVDDTCGHTRPPDRLVWGMFFSP